MVLRFIFSILLIFVFFHSWALDLVYTDQNSTNYFIGEENALYLGSDLLRYLDDEEREKTTILLTNLLEESINISHTQYINSNTLKITINTLSVDEAYLLSKKWREDFRDKFNQTVIDFFIQKEHDISCLESFDGILYEIAQTELNQARSHQNLVLNSSIAFSIVAKYSDFEELEKANFSLKRSSDYTYQLTQTTISECANLLNNEMEVSIVGVHTLSRLKYCLLLHVYSILHSHDTATFNIQYGAKQNVLTVNLKTNYFEPFNFLTPLDIDSVQFNIAKEQAIDQIKSIAINDGLFFYSQYDIEMLDKLGKNIFVEDFILFYQAIFQQEKHSICIAKNSEIILDSLQYLSPCGQWSLDNTIWHKKNTTAWENDSLSIDRLNQLISYLNINPSATLFIDGYAHKSEYLKVEDEELKKIIEKYEQSHYQIKKVQLHLARALYVFDYFLKNGIDPNRIICTGSLLKNNDETSEQKTTFRIK